MLGVAIGLMFALLAAAAIVAGKLVVPQETAVEDRGPLLVEEEADSLIEVIQSGGEGISRRALLAGAGGMAGAALVTAAATPIASLGPTLSGIHATPWQRGVRLVDDQGHGRTRPMNSSRVAIHGATRGRRRRGAGRRVVGGPAHRQVPATARHPASWAPHGILAYSKICPHAGCAISLYRYPTYQPTSAGPALTCPCHYSTFSPGRAGS